MYACAICPHEILIYSLVYERNHYQPTGRLFTGLLSSCRRPTSYVIFSSQRHIALYTCTGRGHSSGGPKQILVLLCRISLSLTLGCSLSRSASLYDFR